MLIGLMVKEILAMEPTGKAGDIFIEIPGYACLRLAASAKAGQGFDGLFAWCFSDIRRSILNRIRPQGSPCLHAEVQFSAFFLYRSFGTQAWFSA